MTVDIYNNKLCSNVTAMAMGYIFTYIHEQLIKYFLTINGYAWLTSKDQSPVSLLVRKQKVIDENRGALTLVCFL